MSLHAAAPALGAAILFGASTPIAKLLTGSMSPLLLAGVLYSGSGLGLGLLLILRYLRGKVRGQPQHQAAIPKHELPWLLGAILAGGVAGPAFLMTGLAEIAGAMLPGALSVICAMVVGFAGYGLSLALFVVALRHLGTARTGAYFSVAPLFGVILSFALWPQMPSVLFWMAAALMALGVWLHLRERHEHEHTHESVEHSHAHRHDEHHQHQHDFAWNGDEPHTHSHTHAVLTHNHPHYPDIHHRHRH
jgi:drug/metabolite transporter (DMT)-like permease